MVAYSFMSRFLPDIRARVKTQTIRLPRKRHARPGEGLQLFTGPRMKPLRVGGAVCAGAHDIRLDFDANAVEVDGVFTLETAEQLNAFAVRDGFTPPDRRVIEPWAYMARFWAITHPGKPVFVGVLIDWGSSFEAAA